MIDVNAMENAINQPAPQNQWSIRPVQPHEIAAVKAMIDESARALSVGFYTHEEIEASVEYIFGVDTELVEDQTYFVVVQDGKYLASGGWSRRRTLFGGDQFAAREPGYLDPATEPAKIRAFFTHPDAARTGVASYLLAYCEAQAKAAGFQSIEMMATLAGIPFYTKRGYLPQAGPEVHVVPSGIGLGGMRMYKRL